MSWLMNKQLWIVAGVVIAIGVLVSAVILYGNSRYNEGKTATEIVWQQRVTAAVTEAREQERQLAAETARRAAEAHQRDLARARALNVVHTEIENAPDFEARYTAYVNHRNSLRDARTERVDRARADYLSTIVISEPVEP